jgi:hypothetical protein
MGTSRRTICAGEYRAKSAAERLWIRPLAGSEPVLQEWVVVGAVTNEPVYADKFPAIREIYREFRTKSRFRCSQWSASRLSFKYLGSQFPTG